MTARARLIDRTAIFIVRALGVLMVALLGWIVVFLLVHGWQELTRAGFFSAAPNIGGAGSGVGPQLYNTAYVLVLSLIFTVPLGVAAGIYFAEYAGIGPVTNAIRRATETLATLPSIIVGLFGYALFVQATHSHPSRLAAALSLTVINLPYAVRVTEDSLRNLPAALREGSLALGATRWQTISRVLLPAALPALLTGLIIVAGRAFGEAAAILFAGSAGAITAGPNYNLNPLAQGDTLAVDLYVFRTQAEPNTVPDAVAYEDGVAALLVLVVLIFNGVARMIGRIAVRRLQGG